MDRDPQHLHRPHRHADHAEQRQVDDQHQADALPAEARIHITLDPVIGAAMAELGDGFLVLGLGAIEFSALQQHLADAAGLRAVRIVLGLALGVVLAMDRGPLPGDHAGGQPQPEAEEMLGDRVQVQRPVRHAAVQEDGDASDGDVRHHQGVDDDLPPGPIGKAVGGPVKNSVEQTVLRRLNRDFPVQAGRAGAHNAQKK
ncbi:hypothetical protein D9M72_442080 [compost metagenome]